MRLCCLPAGDHREVDVGLCDFVDVIRPGVERDVQHDLDNLRVIIAGGPERIDVVLTDVAAFTRDLDGETYCGSRKGSFELPLRFAKFRHRQLC